MILSVDASVALKWFLNVRGDESDCERARDLLLQVQRGEIALAQPVHFIAEVAAVLAREKPKGALEDLRDLLDVEQRIIDTPETFATALELSIRHQHHLFDTLYHAVALQSDDGVLVTADRRYYDKARGEGGIGLLSNGWPPA